MNTPALAILLPAETILIGLVSGLAYAILAAGLVLVYRATRVINFAHGEIGAFGAALLAKLVLDLNWNYVVAAVVVIVIGAAIGAAVELGVVRRLFNAPRLVLLVATIGVAQVIFFAQAILPGTVKVAPYPTAINRVMQVGSFVLRGEHFMVLALVPALMYALHVFLNRTPFGLGIRAAADNADAARLATIGVKPVSTAVWVVAGILSTVTAILINPVKGTIVGIPSVALGPALLLRALTAGLVGRLVSLPLALAGGVAVGVFEAVLLVNFPTQPGLVDAILFVAVLALVLVRGRSGAHDSDEGTFALAPALASIPRRLRNVAFVRRLPQLMTGVALLGAVILPLVVTSASQQFLFSRMLIFAIIGLSVTVLTGWAGQLSLGQFAFVGVGAFTTAMLVTRGMPYPIAVLDGVIVGVIVALAVGLPALRIRGLFLAITTLAFAVAGANWLFHHDAILGDASSLTVSRGQLGPIDLTSQRAFYYVCLAALVASALMVARLRTSGIGRRLLAVRDNEIGAASYSVSPRLAKLTAFGVSGGLAALAGGLLAGAMVQVGPGDFPVDESLRVVAMTIIGGLGTIAGPILGAVYVLGMPAIFGQTLEVRLLTSGVGLLVLLLYFPGGLVSIFNHARDAWFRRLERTLDERGPAPDDAPPRAAQPPPAVTARLGNGDRPQWSPGVAAVQASGIHVRFGGVTALDNVEIVAETGEKLGLIGANGAGKSTLMNVISGFIVPDSGDVMVRGQQITSLPAHDRPLAGLGRVFQDARLFPSLTVHESILVALESRERAELVPSLLALPPSTRGERWKHAEAGEIISTLGLGRYADSPISALSTGTRRIVELACLLALRPSVLLLDEPTAGLAQRETEAFGPLITRLRDELDATLVIIEHDLPLVLSITDRVYCLNAGTVIASGTPEEVRNDELVVASYLGTDQRAIDRSDAATERTDD